MKTLKTYNPTNPKSPYYDPEWNLFLTEQFITPLQAMGFKFIGTITTNYANETGAHILHFEHDHVTDYDNNLLHETTHFQDEGSQSHALNYYGTLVLTYIWCA